MEHEDQEKLAEIFSVRQVVLSKISECHDKISDLMKDDHNLTTEEQTKLQLSSHEVRKTVEEILRRDRKTAENMRQQKFLVQQEIAKVRKGRKALSGYGRKRMLIPKYVNKTV